jgi:hypothetical protein
MARGQGLRTLSVMPASPAAEPEILPIHAPPLTKRHGDSGAAELFGLTRLPARRRRIVALPMSPAAVTALLLTPITIIEGSRNHD